MNITELPRGIKNFDLELINNKQMSKFTIESEDELHLQINDFVAYAHQNPNQNCIFKASFLKEDGSLADMPAVKIIFRANNKDNGTNENIYITEVILKNHFIPKFTKQKEDEHIELDYFPLTQEALPFLLKDYEEHVQKVHANSDLHIKANINNNSEHKQALDEWAQQTAGLSKIIMETLPENIRPKLHAIALIEKGDDKKSKELIDLIWKKKAKNAQTKEI